MNKNTLWLSLLVMLVGIPVLGLVVGSPNRFSAPMDTLDYAEAGMAREVMEPMAMVGNDQAVSKMMAPTPGYTGAIVPEVDRTVIKTAFMSAIAQDVRSTVDQIKSEVSQLNGLITSLNIYDQPAAAGSVTANLTIRIPAADLDQLMSNIGQLAEKVTHQSVDSQDVTEQKIDLAAQIRNQQAAEAQLLNLMNKAETVEETLQVQRELTSVRTTIEQLQAQIDNLAGAAQMSTLQITLTSNEVDLPITDPSQRSILDEIVLALKDGLRLYRELFVAGVRGLVIGSPLLVIGGIGLLIWKKRKIV